MTTCKRNRPTKQMQDEIKRTKKEREEIEKAKKIKDEKEIKAKLREIARKIKERIEREQKEAKERHDSINSGRKRKVHMYTEGGCYEVDLDEFTGVKRH